eukprot:366014-Chlamydomonas_euryale.AAC.14
MPWRLLVTLAGLGVQGHDALNQTCTAFMRVCVATVVLAQSEVVPCRLRSRAALHLAALISGQSQISKDMARHVELGGAK